MDLSESKRTRGLICAALALATFCVYCRVGGFDFVNYDDPEYVTENAMVRPGLTLKGIVWAFTHCYASNWHPLTWISHMLDCQIFGVRPAGPHWENVAWHAGNSVLLFLLLYQMTRAQWRSAAVAALFALHPLHVESVAWISERKDVLSAFFGLSALLAYVQYVAESKVQPRSLDDSAAGTFRFYRWRVVALALFGLSLLAKPMLVTLPFVMLLLDLWPLQRVENTGWRTLLTPQFGRLVREKWVWFVLSAASSVMTIYAQKTGGSVMTVETLPIFWRLVNAIESCFWYLEKTFWPTHLAMFYPLERQHAIPSFACECLILLAVSLVAVRTLKGRPYLFTGWFWFIGMLVPICGVLQVGDQHVADRYSYLPSIGLFILIIWGSYEQVKGSKFVSRFAAGAVGISLVLFAAATVLQSAVWKNGLTLSAHTISTTHNNDIAWNNYGDALFKLGRFSDAATAFNTAIEINASLPFAHKNLGQALNKLSKPDEALVQFERAAQLNPTDADTQNVLANELAERGKREDALAHYEAAVKLRPDNALYQDNEGIALAAVNRKADALAYYAEAARLEPTNAGYQNNFATALARAGQKSAAIEHYQTAIQDDPKFAEPYSNLGTLHASENHWDEAARDYAEAVRLEPTNATIHLNAGLVFLKVGRQDEAMNHFAEAVRLNPDLADGHYELGRQFLLRGQLHEARDQLRKAVQLKPDYASSHFYLGLACLKLGAQPEALEQLQEAARLRPNWTEPLDAAAWLLATSPDDKIRNGAEAVRLAEHATNLTSHQQPEILRTLAAAYAETGHFNQAIATANQAIETARSLGQTNLTADIEHALELYKASRPLRETAPEPD